MRLLHAAGLLATGTASSLPAFLDAEVAERLNTAIHKRDVVLAMTAEDLQEDHDVESGEGILNVIMHTRAQRYEYHYMGVSDYSNVGPKFSAAWSALLPPSTKECERQLSMFWLVRPHWFAASYDDVVAIRFCVHFALNAISSATEENAEHANVLASIAAHLMVPLYAASTQAFVIGGRHTEIPTDFKFFQQYVRESEVLTGLLNTAAEQMGNSGLDGLELGRTDAKFATLLLQGGNDRLLKHAGDFMDKIWGESAVELRGEFAIPLWKALVEKVTDFDSKEYVFDSYKPPIRTNSAKGLLWERFHHYRAGMGLARTAWRNTVGSLISSLQDINAHETNSCLPESVDPEDPADLYMYLDDHMGQSVLTVYKCLVEKISGGAIVIPPETEGFPSMVGVIMHMTRMISNTLAYKVQEAHEP